MDASALAALVFALVALGVIAFQFALALGAPWGAYAMGGSIPARFPTPLRIAAVVQAVVIGFIALAMLSAGGWPSRTSPRTSPGWSGSPLWSRCWLSS